MARNRISERVERAIQAAHQRYPTVPVEWLRRIARVESGFNPTAQTGSYTGLFQLGPEEFRRAGTGGEITNPADNAMAAAALMAGHRQAFERRYQREPSLGEMYMIHQQGWGGLQAHLDNPDRPAWQNMAGTREGRARGQDWARRAIWGNVPRGERGRFRDVEEVTSREFFNIWDRRLQPSQEQITRGVGTLPEAGVDPELGMPVDPNTPNPDPTAPLERPPQRAPSEAPEEPGRNYPGAYALTGRDEPVGRQLLRDIFGGEGLATGRMMPGGQVRGGVGAGLQTAGAALARSATQPLPQLPPTQQTPDQEIEAFSLPQRPRRRPVGQY